MTLSIFQSAEGSQNPLLNQRLQYELDRLRQKFRFPGATCAYILSNGTIGEVASGIADTETNTPMTIKSKMLTASIGKTFVGATVVALAKEGLINLDAPLSCWLGKRSWYACLPNHETITLRHLLTHSSGLPDHVYSPKFLQNQFFSKLQAGDFFSPESLIECILDQPALFEAGRGWSYTDTGYILLGLAIEAITGDEYYKVVKQRFLKPLKLDMTAPSDRPNLPGLIAGYTSPDNAFGLPTKTLDKSGSLVWNPIIEWTGGGMISTSHDLARWTKLLYEGRAIQSDYLEELFQAVPINDDGSNIRYGAGVVIQKSPLGDKWGHYGVIPGYVSSMRYYSKYGLAVAFQVNTDINASDLINNMEPSLAEIIIQWKQDKISSL
jgi:Beta-lactamase class C and other penicillin binding proteins